MKGADGLGSLRNRTAMQTFFGQVGLDWDRSRLGSLIVTTDGEA